MIGLLGSNIVDRTKAICAELQHLDEDEKISVLNAIKQYLHDISPFRNEPVDCVLWIKAEDASPNEYNPNAVAPPEMRLLEHSITEDGYTQPIVTWLDADRREVIDGFHRYRVGTESKKVKARLQGYLPVTTVNEHRTDLGDRMASTIRHNRARGKHKVAAMAEIVVELSRRNWSDQRIAKDLGMDADEVLRLKQITGLAELFADREFSEAWEPDEELLFERRKR